MSVAEIEQQLKEMSKEERHRISEYLVKLELSEDPDYWARIRRRMADTNPEHWIPLEEIVALES